MDEPYASIPSHVANSLKKMIKNVQVTGDSIDEEDLDEAVGFHLARGYLVISSSLQGCQGP
jgi:hypothetical protein